ncbi:MAG: carboxymuconolactone decarboxylase family protein [Acidimicrobiaceae bacterium]|nr:carboxymuconolactone decarboxylase family protein [Acidimicrobiaceae bacterium]
MGNRQRISYFPLDEMDDQVRAVVERCAREGVPRPESSAVRAHSLGAFWAFEDAWQKLFRSGLVAHEIKELCRVYVSRSVKCEYCGNQRSLEARAAGIGEGKLDELLNFESSEQYSEKERAALSYAEAITWRLNPDDGFWARLSRHFNEEELVELAGFISLTMGQQSWIRLLNIDHFEVLGGGSAAMAPGLDDPDALARARDSETYWAKS